MKYVIFVLLGLVGISLGAPQQRQDQFQNFRQQGDSNVDPNYRPTAAQTQQRLKDQSARILRFENVNNGDGTYNYNYETDNGIVVEESGFLVNRGGGEDPIQNVKGSYQYNAPEGQLYRVEYVANEGGFQPKGDHLPTPPPIPPAIQKALQIIYANAEKQKIAEQQQQQNRNRF